MEANDSKIIHRNTARMQNVLSARPGEISLMLGSPGTALPWPDCCRGQFTALRYAGAPHGSGGSARLRAARAGAAPPGTCACCHGQGDLLIRELTRDWRTLDSVQSWAASPSNRGCMVWPSPSSPAAPRAKLCSARVPRHSWHLL